MKNIDSLLKPLKVLDEEISRPYARLTKKWEDKGHSRYSLSGACDIFSGLLIYQLIPNLSYRKEIPSQILGGSIGFSAGDSLCGFYGLNLSGLEEKDRKYVINPIRHAINKFIKLIRMPELATGVGLAGKGAYDIYNYFHNGEPTLNDGVNNLLFGASFISNASAWYIRQSDPKILDKKSVFKKAFEKAKEKMGELIPSPTPIPDFKPAYVSLRNS